MALEVLPGARDPLAVVCRADRAPAQRSLPARAPGEPVPLLRGDRARTRSTSASPTITSSPAANRLPCCSRRSPTPFPRPTDRRRPDAAPDLYPRDLPRPVRAPSRGVRRRACSACRGLLATSRRSFRPRYRGGDERPQRVRLLSARPGPTRRAPPGQQGLGRDGQRLLPRQPAAGAVAARRRSPTERRRRELAVASIVNARDDFGADAANARSASSWPRSASPIRCPRASACASWCRTCMPRRRGSSGQALPADHHGARPFEPDVAAFCPSRAGERFFAKHHPAWGGVTALNVDALWGNERAGHAVQSSGLPPGGAPPGRCVRWCFAVTTAQDALHVGVSYRTAAFSRADVDDVIAGFRAASTAWRRPKLAPPERLSRRPARCSPQPGARPPRRQPGERSRRGTSSSTPSLRSLAVDPVLEERILALDPDAGHRRRCAHDRSPAGPTPRIMNVHGGIYPVHLVMESFARFLTAWAIPEAKIRHPGDGRLSHSPYEPSSQIAGTLAWYYEREGMMPMLVGHSQGGIQAVKVLYELAGAFGDRIRVWNPLTDAAEDRDHHRRSVDRRASVRSSVCAWVTCRSSAPAARRCCCPTSGRWQAGCARSRTPSRSSPATRSGST